MAPTDREMDMLVRRFDKLETQLEAIEKQLHEQAGWFGALRWIGAGSLAGVVGLAGMVWQALKASAH
jgi:hypothetical protein